MTGSVPRPSGKRQVASRGASSSDHVARSLSHAIHVHRLAPGTKLGEDDLAEIFGVSRTIIRAALQALSHTQLVEIHRNRGAFVAHPTPEEAHDVFEARLLLEPRTAHLAALRATPEDIASLTAHVAEEHAAVADEDRGRTLYLSGRLHVLIARIAAQPTIAGFVETLIARSSLIVALYWKRESALCERHAHDAIVRAIEARDPDAAEAIMRDHLTDLHADLDLRRAPAVGVALRDILG